MTTKLYAQRDTEKMHDCYFAHVSAMTSEGLHSKSAIAAELAWRDTQIAELQEEIKQMHEDAAGIDI